MRHRGRREADTSAHLFRCGARHWRAFVKARAATRAAARAGTHGERAPRDDVIRVAVFGIAAHAVVRARELARACGVVKRGGETCGMQGRPRLCTGAGCAGWAAGFGRGGDGRGHGRGISLNGIGSPHQQPMQHSMSLLFGMHPEKKSWTQSANVLSFRLRSVGRGLADRGIAASGTRPPGGPSEHVSRS